MLLRRYEILLPLRYNDGSPIEPEKFDETRSALLNQFRGATFDPHPVRGWWTRQGVEYEDALVRIVIDVEDTAEARAFFTRFKEILKERFKQVEIWMTYYQIGRV